MPIGTQLAFVDVVPETGAWLLYADSKDPTFPLDRCIAIAHHPGAWRLFETGEDAQVAHATQDLQVVFPESNPDFGSDVDISFDLVANAFYFLSSWSERLPLRRSGSRKLHANSCFARLGISQDIVDRYLECLRDAIDALPAGRAVLSRSAPHWTHGSNFAVALSHDVDFLPGGIVDNLVQGSKTVLRHFVRQRDLGDALRAGMGFTSALLRGRDPYGCVPEIIAQESARGVRSSFQVAVARRHPADVNYDIRDDRVRDYLRVISEAGFDLCLHGSYRSTERIDWYIEEANLLSERLARPLGSRQHYLSFDYDTLFRAQEVAGIRYDMSMGYPDHCGSRAGFSFPYFPYCLEEERPYDVLEIPLFYMDVTLQSYMRLSPRAAWDVLEAGLQDLKRKGGAVSVVWHPIVFGGARDPGYDKLYWKLVERIQELGGLATDARTIHDEWRRRARSYASFAHLSA